MFMIIARLAKLSTPIIGGLHIFWRNGGVIDDGSRILAVGGEGGYTTH